MRIFRNVKIIKWSIIQITICEWYVYELDVEIYAINTKIKVVCPAISKISFFICIKWEKERTKREREREKKIGKRAEGGWDEGETEKKREGREGES
jgi:hypothetical protein